MLDKRRVVAGGRTDIEIIDNIGILAANGLIGADEFGTLRRVEVWLSQVRRAHGIADGHVGRLWAQLLSGARGGRRPAAPGNAGRTPADAAWERLLVLRAVFMRLDLLPALEVIVAVAGGERGPGSRGEPRGAADGLRRARAVAAARTAASVVGGRAGGP